MGREASRKESTDTGELASAPEPVAQPEVLESSTLLAVASIRILLSCLLLGACSRSELLESDVIASPDDTTLVVPLAENGTGSAGTKNGPVAWYRFEESSGPVLDSSGGHHGVAEGTGYQRGVPGRVGNAISFDGTDGRVRVPAAPALDVLTGATVELWLRMDSIDPSSNTMTGNLFSRGTGNSDDHELLNTTCGNVQMSFSHSFASTNVTSSCGLIQAGDWTHLALVNDGVTLSLFVNGAFVASQLGGRMGPLKTDLYMGRRQPSLFPLRGVLDEVKWWNVARSQSEICADAEGTWQGTTCLL
jgi:hypothetical protein